MVGADVSINRKGVIVIAIVIVGLVVFYQLRWRSPMGAPSLFAQQEVDVTTLPEFPPVSISDVTSLPMSVTIAVDLNGKKLDTYSLQLTPESSPKGTVLLLHGLGDSSYNWLQANTFQLLAHWGYRAVAVDLPGHGRSVDLALGDISNEDYMAALLKGVLGPEEPLPVIVAPSMGGSFAIPYLFQDPAVGVQRAAGFVAVAPVWSEKFEHNYAHSQLSTLILYGEGDIRLGRFSREKLQTLPNSHIITIPNAGHAVFKDQPDLFHRALYHYLTHLMQK